MALPVVSSTLANASRAVLHIAQGAEVACGAVISVSRRDEMRAWTVVRMQRNTRHIACHAEKPGKKKLYVGIEERIVEGSAVNGDT
jgi:hypothetical protein